MVLIQLRARLSEARNRLTAAPQPDATDAPAADDPVSAERPLPDHLQAVLDHHRQHPADDLVLITRRGDPRVGNSYSEHLPATRIHQVSLRRPLETSDKTARDGVTVTWCRGPKAIVDHLTGIRAPQAIVDLVSDSEHQRERFAALFYFLDGHPERSSLYLAQESATGDPDDGLVALLTRLEATETAPLDEFSSPEARLAEAVDSVTQRGRLVTVTARGRFAVKLRDRQAPAVLEARRGAGWGEQLVARPAVQFTSRATVWTNVPAERFGAVFSVPELFLREYRDVVCAPRGIALAGDVMLPVSFHKLLTPFVRSHAPDAPNVSGWSVAVEPAPADAPRLAGAYFYLDSPYPWGFGHFMGEDMSRLWAWEQAKARYPDLRVLLSSAAAPDAPPASGRPSTYQLALLDAVGIGADDVVCLDRPARVELLVGASRMWENPRFVHPELTAMWDARRDALRTATNERSSTPRKVFVSRGDTTLRRCRNAVEVEQLFASHGFAVVEPETLDMAGQVDVFAGAEVVAGFGGSAMFNMMHAEHPRQWIVIASSTYTARNEYLIAAARGGDYHHFVCEAVKTELTTAQDFNFQGFHWDFGFDFARDGASLENLLRLSQ